MKVREIMSMKVHTCRPDQPLWEAARIMWDEDVGALPVIDREGHVVGMITDRDICMHAYTTGNRLGDDTVAAAMAGDGLVSASPEEDVADAERDMGLRQVRRVPVLEGGVLTGVLSVTDLARAASTGTRTTDAARVTRVLASIARPHVAPVS